MSQYDALHQILGKTIKGVVLKKNEGKNLPAISLFLVFTDDTYYEIYSLYQLSVASGLSPGGLAHARAYGTPPKGPMTNVLELSFEDD
jgi:hypothetical protein